MKNDPIRARNAWIRLACAVLAAVLLLAVSGAVKLLSSPKSLQPEAVTTLEIVGSEEPEPEGTQPGDYVEHEVFLILKNFAEGSRGGKVVERYAVVPVNGELMTFCFPQRWLESEQSIVDATQDLLNGVSYQIDKYIVVRGTVCPITESVSAELYSWFGENQSWLTQGGLIPQTEDAAEVLSDQMVVVDQVGRLPMGWAIACIAAAGLCLLYALVTLIRILAGRYPAKAAPIDYENFPQPIRSADAEAADEDGIEVEITESDPETGEDVTDLEVEIVEEEPNNDAEA